MAPSIAPEPQSRQTIDDLLAAAGRVLQDRADFNRHAAEGVAVRELPLPGGTGDDLLFVGGKACGVIEARKAPIPIETRRGQALRQSILKAAFSGQLVPQEPSDQPAGARLARLAAQSAAGPAVPKRRGRPARQPAIPA